MYGDIANVKTEIEGLSTDSDGDGVSDAFDAITIHQKVLL